jgi:hypothetical protein
MKNYFYSIFLLLPIFLFAHEPPQTKPEIQNYIDTYLKVIEVDARYIDTYYTLEKGKNVPAIKFAVKNLGNETITYLKATVYFLDKNGQPFYEETYSPISEYADMNELKPNYTFRLARESYWTVKEISSNEWSKRVRVEITNVKFKK